IDLGEIKTKSLVGVLSALQAGEKSLVVDDRSNQNLRLSIRNLPSSRFLPPEGVNVYDLLCHDHLVVSKDAAKALESRCLDSRS
ncbi:MAG TPA: 50S ribosomal protein L4, partial [Polyangiaceae bacterium]